MGNPLEEARRSYAEELRSTARVTEPAVVEAFAAVPRERFVGSGPWRILSPLAMGEYWTTEDADPRHLYHDVLVAIDEVQRLNNGQPSLWARMYDQLALARGAELAQKAAAFRQTIDPARREMGDPGIDDDRVRRPLWAIGKPVGADHPRLRPAFGEIHTGARRQRRVDFERADAPAAADDLGEDRAVITGAGAWCR